MKLSIAKLRKEYAHTHLHADEMDDHPLKQFAAWLHDAVKADVFEPNAMTLATLSQNGRPATRTVLLKQLSKEGLIFYTNYTSRKGEHIAHTPYVSLNFWWKEIYRQVIIEGRVKKVSRQASCAYFSTRPRGAQLAACASLQSSPLASRDELKEIFLRLKKKYHRKAIPCPKTWGGYLVIPDRMEFWQGQPDRLHDRFLYVKVEGSWTHTRLFP